ncbi:L-threonylcarbamoyladenylate synthase [Paraburkholderia susongensis]|uniref:Threonylcarbamoyl-AMP synthase n=1 Tax=Paraburkholderia susongensis TaxID=1515439 RepID=A0A1X7I0C7_9BURK|nr:Sua5/YciO/YrdC/YwlC family protein [Paraburkholderia susongensis]SMG07411.1 translation factor SUA5 [Paraburkholderia susongensis]
MERFALAPDQLTEFARCIKDGGVVAYPTEAMFGLGCDPANQSAVARLCALKERSLEQGVILACGTFEQTLPYVRWDLVPQGRLAAIHRSWPGPVTWVLPASDLVPAWIRGRHAGVAVRVSAHTPIVALCGVLGGPVVSTSANLHGHAPARSVEAVEGYFAHQLDALLDAPIGELGTATKIFDAMTGQALRG